MTGRFGVEQYSTRAMGSILRAMLVGCRRGRAGRAWALAVEDMERTEAALSRFRSSSDLTRFNRRAGDDSWRRAGDRLYAMVAMAARAQRVTGGRFDARVLRRLEELGEHAGVPLPALGRPAVPRWDDVERSPGGLERRPRERAIRVAEPIDSGGLGKGLGLRWAARAARSSLPPGSGLLLEAGGDIVASGPQPDGGPWRIGIEDPHGGGEPMAVIELRDGAVATSSTAVRRWTAPDGQPVHHLIDPRTGQPGGEGLVAVTVALADPAWAEVWSKALFLAGPSRIGPEARSRGLAAWWVRDDGTLEMTPAARARTIWEAPLVRQRSA
jgi:thiamine biosynthesis lipoprotein